MQKAWNPEKKFFAQSYDDIDVLDSAVLIMPLVFFATAVSKLQVTLVQVDLYYKVRSPLPEYPECDLEKSRAWWSYGQRRWSKGSRIEALNSLCVPCRTSFTAMTHPSLTTASVGRRVLSVFALCGP
jgi:hypothetical protein